MLKLRLPWRIKHILDLLKVRIIKSLTHLVFLSILKTPPILSDDESDVEVHTLVDHDFLIFYLIAIKSLYLFSKRKFSIYCHCCKRNMTEKDIEILKKHIIGVNYINRDYADKRMREQLSKYRVCNKYRNECEDIIGTSAKLFDQLLISKANKLILIDADTIFLNYPAEIVKWAKSEGNESLYVKDIVNWYCIPYPEINKVEGLPKVPPYFNAGLLCFNKLPLTGDLRRIEEMTEIIETKNGDFVGLDQTIYALLLPNKRLLPETYTCTMSKIAADNSEMVFRHYVGRSRRFSNLTYLTEGKKIINKLMKVNV